MHFDSGVNAASIAVVLLSGMLAAMSGCADASARDARSEAADPEGAPVALVELFTSEGCSSCPPADKLLSALADDAREKNVPVYLLAFHVDYWDGLGWPDPYADAAYTRRQRQYAEHFAARGLYTPQMIVNGAAEFVGSDKARAAREIEQALERKSTVSIALKTLSRSENIHRVEYAVTPVPPGALLHVALVERELVTSVPRGENAGRNLRHDNVVRHFQTIKLEGAAGGTADLPLPTALRPENASVIAYVQNAGDMSILGAASISLGGAATRPASAAR